MADLADLIHDAMPGESDWQRYFRVEQEADGWSLVIARDLSRHIAAYLVANGIGPRDDVARLLTALPPGPYRVVWPDAPGNLFALLGRYGTPPDFTDGWAVPLVAEGVDGPIKALADFLNGQPR